VLFSTSMRQPSNNHAGPLMVRAYLRSALPLATEGTQECMSDRRSGWRPPWRGREPEVGCARLCRLLPKGRKNAESSLLVMLSRSLSSQCNFITLQRYKKYMRYARKRYIFIAFDNIIYEEIIL